MKHGILVLAIAFGFPAWAGDSARDLLACMQGNVPDSLRVQEVLFESSDGKGASSMLKGRLYAERMPSASGEKRVHAMLKISSPQNLAGAAYLVREKEGENKDGMYVYLPSVKRVRRVTGNFADSGLMGTSFNYSDFRMMQNSFDDAALSLEGEDEIDKRVVRRLLVRPASASQKPGGYGVARFWVDKESCVPLKAEFEQDGAVRKLMSTPASALQRSGTRWYPATVEMRDQKMGTRTLMQIRSLSAVENLSSGYFDPSTFYQR